jgi:hypothetical protein
MEEQYVEKKKSIISKSTKEVEFRALVTTNDEVGWLHDFIYEIFTWKKPIPPILIHCESIAIIGTMHNKYYNGYSRYIKRKYSIVKSYMNNSIINVDYISTKNYIVDHFTKALAKDMI